jgi:hypothetical protein
MEIDFIPYSIQGTIVNGQSSKPITGAKISVISITPLKHEVYTNNQGTFILNGETTSEDMISLDISYEGFESQEIIPYNGNNTIKSDIGIIQLSPTQTNLESDKISASQLSEKQIDLLSLDKKDFKFFTQKKLNNSINDIKNKLLPVIITLIAEFGVTGVQKLIDNKKDKLENLINQTKCPTPAQLTELINKKNKLVKQLNQLFKVIDSATKALGITGGIIEALNIAYQILKNLPIPSAVAGVGVPISLINTIQDNKEKLDKLIVGLRAVNAGTLIILILLRQVLSQALQYLSLLDTLVEHCYPEAEQEKISIELTVLVAQQTVQTSPVVTNVNGFEMGVETESTTKSLKRRRAIARNKSGVVMLTGEWSFSSIDQILIDELSFYIQQNNLKAD